jgi:predicted transcriptional regulator
MHLPAAKKNVISQYKYLQMSKEEIKYEINKVLDHLSDKSLEELLLFLKKIHTDADNAALLEKIIAEDRELLDKLAQ